MKNIIYYSSIIFLIFFIVYLIVDFVFQFAFISKGKLGQKIKFVVKQIEFYLFDFLSRILILLFILGFIFTSFVFSFLIFCERQRINSILNQYLDKNYQPQDINLLGVSIVGLLLLLIISLLMGILGFKIRFYLKKDSFCPG